MNIPEFTAHASLYRTANRYQSTGSGTRSDVHGATVIPQLGGRGYVGHQVCTSDCLDRHPDWSAQRCSRSCNDSGIAGTNGSDDFFGSIVAGLGFVGIGLIAAAGAFGGGAPAPRDDSDWYCRMNPYSDLCTSPSNDFCRLYPADPSCTPPMWVPIP